MSSVPDEYLCPISQSLMKDPVSLPCGHTFDRDSLNVWLEQSQTCPTCRRDINGASLVTNWSLKSLIESNGIGVQQVAVKKQVSVNVGVENVSFTELASQLEKSNSSFYNEANLYNVTIEMPKCEKRRPLSIVCVIDVSGSMATSVGAAEGNKAFTRLDLVKHVLNVVIASLTELDSLSLVTFSTNTKVILDLCDMTEANKRLARNLVKDMTDESSTVTLPGIKSAYEIITKAPKDNIKSIVLLTDGQDTNGDEMLMRAFDRLDRPLNVQFNTFGFSNDIWSHLLEHLAKKGSGIFGFIPDQSMIGTIFLNFLANTFLTFMQNVEVCVSDGFEFVKPNELKHKVLSYNQNHNFLLKRVTNRSDVTAPVITLKIGGDEIATFKPSFIQNTEQLNVQKARFKLLEFLTDKNIPKVNFDSYTTSSDIQNQTEFLSEFQQTGVNNINFEQLKLSCDFYNTWGAHYLRSFTFAHVFEQTLNFKSPSMRFYTNDKFNSVVDDLTDIFCNLEPPQPSGFTYASQQGGTRITMTGIMNAHGGCIAEECLVQMETGGFKTIGKLAKNDAVMGGGKVVCNIKTDYDGDLVQIDKLLLTPYHPVRFNNQWIFPIDAPNAKLIRLDHSIKVCNLVLDRHHSVMCEAIECITLGHGLEDGVLKHAYYGTQACVNDMRLMKGWSNGLIYVKRFELKHDHDDFVCGMDVLEYGIEDRDDE